MAVPSKLSIASYIQRRLDRLCSITPASCKRLEEILAQVCSPSSVFPTINPDGEGGVSAVWHAGGVYALEVIVENDLETFAVLTEPGQQIESIAMTDIQAVDKVRIHLGNLSVYVEQHNPDWRQLISMP